MGEKCQKPAQFVAHWWLIVLFFGSCQTDHWLPRYGCFKFWVVGMCRYMYVHACMCMYVYVSVGIVCIWPLGHGNHHSVPETPSRDPHQGGPTQGTPEHVPNHFLTPSQYPTSTLFWDFCSKIGVWTCIATAAESATSIGTGQNIAH